MSEVDVETTVENMTEESVLPLEEILKPFPPGPLSPYRESASFDWRTMKLFLEGEDLLRFKVTILTNLPVT